MCVFKAALVWKLSLHCMQENFLGLGGLLQKLEAEAYLGETVRAEGSTSETGYTVGSPRSVAVARDFSFFPALTD